MPDLFDTEPAMQRDACISACGRYRWSLSRAWDADLLKPWVGFVMLNPSTADASIDDPTIRRCIGFARAWGFAGLAVRNLFALRATYPMELMEADDPIGPENDRVILSLVGVCPVIVAAWGVHGALKDRGNRVRQMLSDRGQALKCLGTTKEGHPKHPLYLPADTALIDFE
jgi:hypothetical protein